MHTNTSLAKQFKVNRKTVAKVCAALGIIKIGYLYTNEQAEQIKTELKKLRSNS